MVLNILLLQKYRYWNQPANKKRNWFKFLGNSILKKATLHFSGCSMVFLVIRLIFFQSVPPTPGIRLSRRRGLVERYASHRHGAHGGQEHHPGAQQGRKLSRCLRLIGSGFCEFLSYLFAQTYSVSLFYIQPFKKGSSMILHILLIFA